MEKLVIFVFAIVGINYALGIVKALGRDFDFKVALEGLGKVVKKVIALALLVYGYWYLNGVEVLEIAYAPIFYFIAGLSTVYHTNSALINVCYLLDLEDVKVLRELDDFFKQLKNRSFFKGDEAKGETEGVG